MSVITFDDLDVAAGHHLLLRGVCGNIPRGKIVGLVAPNGSGKTTLMKVLAALDGPRSRGKVSADGIPPSSETAYRKLVFYVPGDASILYPSLTVRENLKIAARCWPVRNDLEVLSDRCAITSFLDKRVRALSLGMKQQAALAVGYMTGARYLILDEPMNALDPYES